MEKVGFLGACDKNSLLMYVAKALTVMQKKVLVVDSTIEQKTRYILPAINPTKSYLIEFDNIDFSVGFHNLEDICEYLGVKDKSFSQINETANGGFLKQVQSNNMVENLPYDYVLINVDSPEGIGDFGIENAYRNYFVTTFDMYSLKKGVDILFGIQNPLKVTKVLYNFDMRNENEEYLDYLSVDCKTIWNDTSVYLPRTVEDEEVIEENQRVFKIRIKKLSAEYQEGIMYIAQDILNEGSISKIRKSIKE